MRDNDNIHITAEMEAYVHIQGRGGRHISQVEMVAMIVDVAVGCCCVLGM